MMSKKIIFPLLVVLFAVSCNKDKKASKCLVKPGTWKVTELSVNGQQDTLLPTWKINVCDDIYEEVCTATWQVPYDEHEFYWQFNEKAKEFVFSHIVDTSLCDDFYTKVSAYQSYQYSGTYKVITRKRKEMEFESNTTKGYTGEKVVIKLEQE